MKNKLKVCNLYAGIGGNRKLWKDVEVTAVEINTEIAAIYQDFFPEDKVIVTDAHEYLLQHYKEYDFIWSSVPCPTHSDIRRCGVHRGQYEALYPDMALYQEIILLKHFAPINTCWVVENVRPYYDLLIPGKEIHRHIFWSNFDIIDFNIKSDRIHSDIVGTETVYGFNIKDSDINNKRKVMRNMVNPELGKHILECAKAKIENRQIECEQPDLFL